MKFSEQFPNARPGDVIELPGESILRSPSFGVCFLCGDQTQFASFSFYAPVCSQGCLDAAWKEVFTPPPIPTGGI